MKTDLGILKKFVWREEKNFEACLNLVDSNIVKGHYAKPKFVNDSLQVQLYTSSKDWRTSSEDCKRINWTK